MRKTSFGTFFKCSLLMALTSLSVALAVKRGF